MTNFLYEAVDAGGIRSKGSLAVMTQSEALRRIKEMGLFPLFVRQEAPAGPRRIPAAARSRSRSVMNIRIGAARIKPAALAVFTRQLATLVDVGMPLLRGLRLLQEQEPNREMKRIIGEVANTVETGGSMSEALSAHPKVFGKLYVNMVRAGEAGGILEQTLKRQAEFMEKALRIKSKVKSAMFYPAAVMVVAVGIIILLVTFVIPRFQQVFAGLVPDGKMPAFTLLVINISEVIRSHLLIAGVVLLVLFAAFKFLIHTRPGRWWFDGFKLALPITGNVTRKVSLARFTRTLGTLLGSGVPILQALTIVRETAGNVIVGNMISRIHDNVKEGGSLADPFKASKIFPAMVGGMVDVGEQTGALPDMLIRIAETSDEEVDNAVSAMTSLLEPVMIIFLAVVVGSIVIAMFLPIFKVLDVLTGNGTGNQP
jgi:type IV pilus assembly protein PilC